MDTHEQFSSTSKSDESSALAQQNFSTEGEQLPGVLRPKPRKLPPWMKYAEQSQHLLKGSGVPRVPSNLPLRTTYHKQEGPEFCRGIVVDENADDGHRCCSRNTGSSSRQQEQQAELRHLTAQCMACKSKLQAPFTTRLLICPKCNTVSPFLSYPRDGNSTSDKIFSK